MVQACYDWVWKLAGYLIFMTAVLQFQDQYDAMETQVEEMLKNTSGLESVMKSQDNRNAEDELSENVEGGEPGGIQVEEIRIGHGSKNP